MVQLVPSKLYSVSLTPEVASVAVTLSEKVKVIVSPAIMLPACKISVLAADTKTGAAVSVSTRSPSAIFFLQSPLGLVKARSRLTCYTGAGPPTEAPGCLSPFQQA